MKPPSSFLLFGATIKVVERNQDNFETNCTYGHWVCDDAISTCGCYPVRV